MRAAELDAEARQRAFVRGLLRDLRLWGVPQSACKGRTVGELIEMHDRARRSMMRAPKAA